MRTRKFFKWVALAAIVLVLAIAGVVYVQISRIPAIYRPARLTAQQKERAVKVFWQKFLGDFNTGAQGMEPYEWSVTEQELNGWLASADEIAASRPSGEMGEVYRAMEKAGLADPAVSLRDDTLTLMIRSKRHDKILSADVEFLFTPDHKLRVSLAGTRIGRVPLSNAWVQGRLDQLKQMVPSQGRTRRKNTDKSSGLALNPEDIAMVLGTVLNAADSDPIETELTWPMNKKRIRIEQATIADGVLRLRVVPLNDSR